MKKEHIVSLDVVRFLAALAVLLYHYTAHDFKTPIEPVTQYGYLGVPLFFMISGFVITMSAESAASPIKFIINRAIRLYPAFITCSLLTITYVAIFTTGPYFTIRELAANMTMFGLTMHVRLINGAYWSLSIEWIFYFMVTAVLAVAGRRGLPYFLWLWTVFSAIAMLHDFGLMRRLFTLGNAPYFVAGAALFLMTSERKTRDLLPLFLLTLPIAIHSAIEGAMLQGDSGRHPVLIVVITLCFYLLMFVVAHLPRSSAPGHPLIQLAGRASYPLYLLHETIGHDIMRDFYIPGGRGVAVTIGLTLAMIVAACVISEYVERPAIRQLKNAIIPFRAPANPA